MSFKLSIMSSSPSSREEENAYNKAYDCFKKVWQSIFKQNFSANSYKRQKVICSIEVEDKVVGVISFDRFNISCDAHKENTYFDDFPKLAKISTGLQGAMKGINIDDIPEEQRLQNRGW